MGVGMIAVVPQESVDVALSVLADRDAGAWVAGEIGAREGGAPAAELVGDYA